MDALLPYLPVIASVLGGGTVSAVLIQLRLWHRDIRRLKFAQHVFDQTRSTDALDGYTRLVRSERDRSSTKKSVEPAA